MQDVVIHLQLQTIISITINIEQNPLHFQAGLGHLLHNFWQS